MFHMLSFDSDLVTLLQPVSELEPGIDLHMSLGETQTDHFIVI